MAIIGYARVSTTGQSLDVQLEKLQKHGCDRVFKEKQSGTTADRQEFKACMDYLREGDTLVITRLDRLARSVTHLSKIADRLDNERIGFVVIDQNFDTTTSSGRLMFNMFAAIAEFENDLRSERQAEAILKAIQNGTKFGRPVKISNEQLKEIIILREEGKTIKEIANLYGVGQATVYRYLKKQICNNKGNH